LSELIAPEGASYSAPEAETLDREYKIGTPSRQCLACAKVFGVGDEYFSAVAETAEEDRLERQDFCPGCWKADQAYFSFWKTRVPEPGQSVQHGPRLVDMGRLLQLFEHLADAPDEPAQRFRYVLALVLMRKRRLRILESRRLPGGGEKLTLREVGTQRVHEVSCPNISEEEIRSVADRLGEILDMPEKWDQVQTTEAEAAPADASSAATDSAANDEPAGEPAGAREEAAVKDDFEHDDDQFDEEEENEEEDELDEDDEDDEEDDDEADDDEEEDDEDEDE
jgi:hypothetical protein